MSRGRRDGIDTVGPGSSDDDRQGEEERARRWPRHRPIDGMDDLTLVVTLRVGPHIEQGLARWIRYCRAQIR
jgi:hypothetical protein